MKKKIRLYKIGEKPTPPHLLWAFQAAFRVMSAENWLELDTVIENEDYEVAESASMQRIPRPDQYVEKILGANLSEEADYVVGLVLGAPKEIIELIATPIHHRITKSRVGQYLRRVKGWPPARVDNTFNELARYTRELGNV